MNVVQRFSSRRALILGAGVLVLGLGAFSLSMRCRCAAAPMQLERWVLHVDSDADDRDHFDGSSFGEGDLIMPRAHHDEPVKFIHQWAFEDGCTWQSVETLTPDGKGSFIYHYTDKAISCTEGSEPNPSCEHHGTVKVLPYLTE